MKIKDVLKKEAIIPGLESKTKPDVIRELARYTASLYPGLSAEKLAEVLIEREKLCSTAVDAGVAIPHGKLGGISSPVLAFGRSIEGVPFESLDGGLTHLFILLVAPENSAGAHLKLLARISKVFKSPALREEIMKAQSAEEIYRIINDEDEKH